jgi:hypothetical protein
MFVTVTVSWVAVFVVPVVTRLMLHHAQTAKARRIAGAVVFPATSLTALCFVSFLFATFIIAGGWTQDARLLTTVGGAIWAVCSLLLWPTTIVVDGNGIVAKHIWRPTRRIRFTEIEYVSRLSNREAVVCGNGKVKEIAVSQYHVGADELEAELRKRGVTYYREGL